MGSSRLLMIIGPGLLVAATGVGAGDLAGAGFAGSKLGYAVLWAVVLGAALKFVITEGIARWQLATGTTILEGACTRLGFVARAVFLAYLLAWTFFVGSALISACGVATNALIPFPRGLGTLVPDPATAGKVVYGLAHSVIAVVLVWRGGYRVFERVMAACIAAMFVTVIVTAVLCRPDWGGVIRGLVVPTIDRGNPESLAWTIGLMGGVGGTLTILAYSYWMRERGRTTAEHLRTCRVDLAVGYVFTALFGVGLVIIASGVTLDAKGGARLIVELADRLAQSIGPVGRWIFLIGAWAAVASSLLGVWQSVPYVFADFWRISTRGIDVVRGVSERDSRVDERGLPYRAYLILIASVPMLGVLRSFEAAQKAYVVFGALFVPMLAFVLLVLNGRRTWVGEHRNSHVMTAVLGVTLALAGLAALVEIRERIG